MSYSVDLWNSYNKVEYQLESHIKGLKTFIYIFSEYYSSQTYLANELKRLSEYITNNPITSFESLSEGISSFQTDLLNQYDYLMEFLNNMKIEIIDPLKLLKEKIMKTLHNNINEINSTEKNYNYIMNQLDYAKKKFHSSVKEAEQFKLKTEIFKRKNSASASASVPPGKAAKTSSNSNSNHNNEEIKKEEIKSLNLLKKAKENENTYINMINEANAIQEDYIEIKKKNLNQIQSMEEEIGENLKDSLRKYIVFQVSYIRNFQYDIDKKAKIMENININKDIFNYINKNSTNALPPFKIDYIPYISELSMNNFNKNKINNNIDKDIIKEVNIFIENIFTIDKAKEILLLSNKVNNEIETISEEIFTTNLEIKDYDKNKLDKINKYISNKRHRRELLKNLNNLRRKKGLNINNITFDNIGKILNDCLEAIINDKTKVIDYDSIIIIINLSSTLYKTSNDISKNMPRIFLQTSIKDHKIWKNNDIWKGVIRYNINEEMHNQKNFNIYSKEDYLSKKERINNIVKFQLNTNLYNMLSFNIKKNVITEIIQEFKNYYDLTQNIIDGLYKIIENDNNNKILNEQERNNKNKNEVEETGGEKDNNNTEKNESDIEKKNTNNSLNNTTKSSVIGNDNETSENNKNENELKNDKIEN
jgi:hypothetical protein